MCGLFGILRLDGAPVKPETLHHAAQDLSHRGPDHQETWLSPDQSIGFAHTRLSIIDLSTEGNQPLHSSDNRLHVMVNGEIYNYQFLREQFEKDGYQFKSHSDSEVCLPLYQERNTAMFQELDGMFAIALWDGTKLILARDPFGKKPLYYCHKPNAYFAFASEIKALEPYSKGELDQENLLTYFANGYTQLPSRSVLTDIRQVRPGHFLSFNPQTGIMEEKPYWQWPVHATKPDLTKPESAWINEFRTLLQQAVEKRLVSDVPLGAYLSGGIDSCSVVALMQAIAPQSKRHTFSIHFTEPTFNNDDHIAELVQHFKLQHHRLDFGPVDFVTLFEPAIASADLLLADLSLLPMYKLAQSASQHVRVVLTGDGADELLGGYSTYRATQWANRLGPLRQPIAQCMASLSSIMPSSSNRNKLNPSVLAAQMAKGLRQPTLAQVHARWRQIFAYRELQQLLVPDAFLSQKQMAYPDDELYDALWLESNGDWLQKTQSLDIQTWLGNNILPKVDRSSMAYGLEARSPFLDKALAAFCAQIPTHLKTKHPKYILRQAVTDLLPPSVIWQPKSGFNTPMSRWFLSEPLVRKLAEHWLLSKEALAHGYFNSDFIRTLWQQHEYRDVHLKLWNLMVFNAWHHHMSSRAH